jgi:hypothetical protein
MQGICKDDYHDFFEDSLISIFTAGTVPEELENVASSK